MKKSVALSEFLDVYPRFLETAITYTDLYHNMTKIKKFMVLFYVRAYFARSCSFDILAENSKQGREKVLGDQNWGSTNNH
jgi:hypothetical protein